MSKEMERIEHYRRLIREMIDASWELAKKKGVMILNQAATAFHASINENELWRMQGITMTGIEQILLSIFSTLTQPLLSSRR